MDVLKAIESRTSIRKFRQSPVKRRDLIKILNAARMAPSGGNAQPWRFIVLADKRTTGRMVEVIQKGINGLPDLYKEAGKRPGLYAAFLAHRFFMNSLFFKDAPVVIAVLVKRLENPWLEPFKRKRRLEAVDAERYFGHIEVQSAAAAVENLLLAAYALGYGGCWMNPPFMSKDELHRILKVRPPWDLMAIVPIGVPDGPYHRLKPGRKNLAQIVTFR